MVDSSTNQRVSAASRTAFVASEQRLNELAAEFERLYPNPQSELNFSNEYQLLVAVILSAQCTDKKVNQVTPKLFQKFPDFLALSKARISEIEKIIRPINYFRSKARNLKLMGQQVVQEHAACLPRSRQALESLGGVGRKTASVVLGELGIEAAFPVDTHVFRVSQRLGLAQSDKRDKVEEQLRTLIPAELWRNMHHWLILHGRRICKAQRPLCAQCSLAPLCPTAARKQ
ncbi:MAG: endonuclease III [Oligoflexia bacterium]|nr:endonuclease III [Oligoflexia bacterium]